MAHIVRVGLAQRFNQRALFHPDAIDQTDQSTGEQDDDAGPIRQRHSHAEQHDQDSRVGGMSHEAIRPGLHNRLRGAHRHVDGEVPSEGEDGPPAQHGAEQKDDDAGDRHLGLKPGNRGTRPDGCQDEATITPPPVTILITTSDPRSAWRAVGSRWERRQEMPMVSGTREMTMTLTKVMI